MDANTTSFKSCVHTWEYDLNSLPGTINNGTIQQFCDNNCSYALLDVVARLKRDCGSAGHEVCVGLNTVYQCMTR